MAGGCASHLGVCGGTQQHPEQAQAHHRLHTAAKVAAAMSASSLELRNLVAESHHSTLSSGHALGGLVDSVGGDGDGWVVTLMIADR